VQSGSNWRPHLCAGDAVDLSAYDQLLDGQAVAMDRGVSHE